MAELVAVITTMHFKGQHIAVTEFFVQPFVLSR
jgi:hypothetical protein